MSATSSSASASFHTLPDDELYALDPEDLVAYIADAKRAGARDAAETGVHMLLFLHETRLRRRVRAQLPAHLQRHADTVADWVLERLLRSALRLQVEGESVGEWINWTETTIRRQTVSFWRSRQGQALEQERTLPSEHEDVDGVRDWLGADFDEERVSGAMDAEAAITAVLRRIGNVAHKAILHSAFWDDLASADVAALHDTTPENVDQVKSRFRRELRQELTARGVMDA